MGEGPIRSRLDGYARRVSSFFLQFRSDGYDGSDSLQLSIDSLASMKARLPELRRKLNADPAYFKKVYLHTFDLCKAPGARVMDLDTGELPPSLGM